MHIKNIYLYLRNLFAFHKKKQAVQDNNHIDETSLKLIFDLTQNNISCVSNIAEYNITEENNYKQAEKLAYCLYKLHSNPQQFMSLVLTALEKNQDVSDQHNLFCNNVAFFWKNFIKMHNTIDTTYPLISPSSVFGIMEEKLKHHGTPPKK